MLDEFALARRAFVLFLMAAGATTGACGGTVVQGAGGGGTGGGTPSACPAQPPAQGSSCSQDGLLCIYGAGMCVFASTVECSGGTWMTLGGPVCAACPAALPAQGSPCDPCCAQTCSYAPGNACGPT